MKIYMSDTEEYEDATLALNRINDDLIDSGCHCYETWSNVVDYAKHLEIQLEKMRRNVIETSEMAYYQASDEFGLSWDDFKFNVLYDNLRLMTDDEIDK